MSAIPPLAVASTEVRRIDHVWIPLKDGTRLSARIWLPTDATEHPVPAILEAIPYRKNDVTAVADEGRHPWFASHGYAAVRVDIRGTGDSEGLLLDEYLAQEQADAVEVIAWLAEQPWCSGSVGMIGYSWGGFAALQVAACQPPALKAIVTVNSTDDRYADDVHYMGGCLLSYYMLSWAVSMDIYAKLPPDPSVVGDSWRTSWHERLAAGTPMIEAWLGHQLRDTYWQHGSVCEDYSAITCPVFAVSGWADGYRSAVLRLMEGLSCPRKALIGPWSHTYAMEDQDPGPAIGFLQECLRWWDHWLKGEDRGILDEPMIRTWMQDSAPPAPTYATRPGRWVSEPVWPAPTIVQTSYFLGEHRLAPTALQACDLTHVGAQQHGSEAGDWDPFGNPADLPPDQRSEDGLSLTFTSDPLDEPIELLGVPSVRLAVTVDKPQAMLVVRLCDVDETGRSCLITRGLMNLSHRDGHGSAVPMNPGEQTIIDVPMKAIGQQIPRGHRLRLAVSTTYWPWAWPSPEAVTLIAHTADSSLTLPVRQPRPDDALLPPFEAPALAPRPPIEVTEISPGDTTITRSIANGVFESAHHYPHVRTFQPDSGLEIETSEIDSFSIEEANPLSARVRCERLFVVGRPETEWQVRIELESEMSSDFDTFHITEALRAFEQDELVFEKSWAIEIPREGV